jgi:hypothetical protein
MRLQVLARLGLRAQLISLPTVTRKVLVRKHRSGFKPYKCADHHTKLYPNLGANRRSKDLWPNWLDFCHYSKEWLRLSMKHRRILRSGSASQIIEATLQGYLIGPTLRIQAGSSHPTWTK